MIAVDTNILVLLGEGVHHPDHLASLVREAHATGDLIHDAHIAALAREHGVAEILTTGRDFRRFSQIRCRNPFVEPAPREKAPGYRLKPRRKATARS